MRLQHKYSTLILLAPFWLGFLLCLASGSANAQYTKERNPWPVIVNGDTLALPFWGGINNPKPALVDFDGDGLLDLMLGEDRGKVAYFKNTGSVTNPVWTPQVERLGNINTGTWFAFADIDADGDPDFFCDNRIGGTAFYRNNSTSGAVVLTLESLSYSVFNTGSANTPTFADIDADGDFDFFIGNQVGGVILYRNNGTETDPFFEFETDSYDSVLAFPQIAPPSGQAPQHGFSALSFADLDDDGDLDLFYGDSFNPSIWYFENLGDAFFSDLRFVSETYFPFINSGFNHSTFGDLDGDNSLEIIDGPANSGKIDNLILMKNMTYPDSITLVVQDFNIIKDIDVGSSAIPAFGDLDGDGDQDMLLGGENGRLAYFENTGTPTEPAFTLITDFFDSISVGVGSAPELVDWDSDGDLDLLLGTAIGKVELWVNTGTTSNFSPTKVGELNDQSGAIKLDAFAIPQTADLNNDGKPDLILGEFDFNGSANILLYKNVGSTQAPSLTLVTKRLLPKSFFHIQTIPYIHDWDGDGRKDLILGSNAIGLTLYRNLAPLGTFPDSLTLHKQPALLPSSDDGASATMRMVDIDSDGDLDIFVGEEDGGLNFYRHNAVTFTRGDIDGLSGVNQADIMYLINFLILNGPAPQPSALAADVNCSGAIDLADVVYLISFLFNSGAGPCVN